MEKFKLDLDPSKYKLSVTFFPRTIGADGNGVKISIDEIIEKSSSTEYFLKVSKLRAQPNKEVRRRYKVKFPCFVPHVFLSGGSSIDNIIDQTNFLLCDWDFSTSEEARTNFPIIASILQKHSI